MKALLVVLAWLFGAGYIFINEPRASRMETPHPQTGHQTASCCASATAEFAALRSDPKFVMAHEAPLPMTYNPANGEWVTFKTPDDSTARGYQIKADKETNTWLFVFQEWWGVNDYIKRQAEELGKNLGVNVIALDLYDGQVATTPDEAQKLMGGVKDDRARAIIKGALAMIGPDARLGTIGWCFGGGWSLQSAMMAGPQLKACVMFYGMPEKDVEKLKTLNAPVLGIFGTQDKWLNPDVVKEFQANMKKAGKSLTVKSYDADHAFANPSNPKFNSKATKDAFKRTYDFLKKNLLAKK